MTTETVNVLGVFDPRHRADPYPNLRALRAAGRTHWLSEQSPRIVVLTRYDDCLQLLTDQAFGHLSMAESAFRPVTDVDEGLRSMLRANPPAHTRLRRLVSRAFTPGRIARFADSARTLATQLLDDAIGRPDDVIGRPDDVIARPGGEVDLVAAFARPLPLHIICTLLGVPAQDEKIFGDWASALTRGLDPDQMLSPAERTARADGTRGFAEYFTALIDRRRTDPADDLLSALVTVSDAGAAGRPGDRASSGVGSSGDAATRGEGMSSDELVDLCVLLLVAGYETTVNLVSGAVLALARDPEQYALLRSRRDLVPAALEETLRYDPPIQWLARSVLADVEIAGHTLRRGDGALGLLAAAQRDPAVFPDPDRFDLTRYAGPDSSGPGSSGPGSSGPGQPARHLGFGQGIHYCLGAPLARLEADIMLNALLDRVARVELTAAPTYRPHLAVRGANTLPVRLIPA
ncbi:cytochrome P450 [Frankia sp. R82]|uniref:cytochrome P450 n=1 Tax=Frankia sp. R82 TaxID=2950553 RepID=UPI0020446B03|nr:cytochrome P450 [Frankia sp. R82]MCM3886792.1 cytochrome P450 [Frankia sp. R82]